MDSENKDQKSVAKTSNCDDSDWKAQRDARRKVEYEAEQAENRRKRIEYLFANAKCPERHVANLDRLDAGNAEWTTLRDDLVKQSEFAAGYLVALLGKRGLGKTELVVSAIHQLCQRGVSCRYVKALDLFRHIRTAFGQKSAESEEKIIAEYAGFNFLVIDELSQRGETDFENNSLTNILDLRYDGRKCTVLIANHSKAEFAEAVGNSIVSRMHETGSAIVCDWPSYRKPGATWKQADGSELRKSK